MRGTSASHDGGDEVAGVTLSMDEAVLMTWWQVGDLLDRDRLRTHKATIEALQMWRKRKLQPPRGWYARMAEFQDRVHRLREMERLGQVRQLFVQIRSSRGAEVVDMLMVQGGITREGQRLPDEQSGPSK